MKKYFLMFLVFSSALQSQTALQFVNCGTGATIREGDDNSFQIINIRIPKEYSGHAYVRLFDMSCGSFEDEQVGKWNSRFRFALYKNELIEENNQSINYYCAQGNDELLSHFESGYDSRYFNNWYTWFDIGKTNIEGEIFSIIVDGVAGDDRNNFELFISSVPDKNLFIEGVSVYSYKPTIPLRKSVKYLSAKTLPREGDNEIKLYTFGFNGMDIYFSTLLQHEIPLNANSSTGWNRNDFTLTNYENKNFCTIDIGTEDKDVNDVTFYFTGSDNKKLPIELPLFEKNAASIPTIVKNISYTDCNTVVMDFANSYSVYGNELNFEWIFDDGYYSIDKRVERKYEQPGKYFVEVLIEDKTGAVSCAKLEKVEIVINQKPVANAGEDINGIPDQPIEFNAGKSYDQDGKIINYFWSFGDGSTDFGEKVFHSYKSPGEYLVTLRVQDDYVSSLCNNSSDSITVNVSLQPAGTVKEKATGSVDQKVKSDIELGDTAKYFRDFNHARKNLFYSIIN